MGWEGVTCLARKGENKAGDVLSRQVDVLNRQDVLSRQVARDLIKTRC